MIPIYIIYRSGEIRTVESPHSRIVRNEANDKIAHWRENCNIATHGILWECGVIVGIESQGVDVVG